VTFVLYQEVTFMKSSNGIEAIVALGGKAKILKSRRKTLRDAKDENDKIAYAAAVSDVEKWFAKYHPDLDISTDQALTTIIKDARSAARVARAAENTGKKKGRDATIVVTADSESGTIAKKSRRETTTMRRAPGVHRNGGAK